MDPNQVSSKQRKRDKKPLYILAGSLVFFILFVYLISRPSLQSKAIREIQICNNSSEVKYVYEKYKFELLETDEDGNNIVSLEFQEAIRKRLQKFKLSDAEVKDCISWLPPAPTSINLIVVPDLSRRIIDTINNSKQIENDKIILKTIWKSFANYSKLKQNTKDRLIITTTDPDQANGRFEDVANDLQFDLSSHVGKSNRLFFTHDKDLKFESNINKMYDLAKSKPLGADYVLFFKRDLNELLKKPTLFHNYTNKVIIITDGYIETETLAYTKIYNYENILHKAVSNGNILDVINSYSLNIPKVDIDLSNTSILVCEVNERRFKRFTHKISTGKNFDYDILKVYWEDWLNRMNINSDNFIFLKREASTNMTKSRIADFIENVDNIPILTSSAVSEIASPNPANSKAVKLKSSASTNVSTNPLKKKNGKNNSIGNIKTKIVTSNFQYYKGLETINEKIEYTIKNILDLKDINYSSSEVKIIASDLYNELNTNFPSKEDFPMYSYVCSSKDKIKFFLKNFNLYTKEIEENFNKNCPK